MKKLLSIVLSITMLVSMGTVAFADGIDGPMQKAVLTVGVNAEFAPFEYYDEDGELAGFDIDLMNYIGERIGFDIEYKEFPFDRLLTAVASGEVDCAISGITITKERESVIDYTTPYLAAQIEVDGELQYEQYAIVFKEGVSKAIYKSSMPTDYEKLFMLVNGTIEELISDAMVEKLIEKYELNKSTAETGYSYFIASEVPGDVEIGADSETTVLAPSEWAAKDIDFAYAMGITDSNKEYIYQNNITREEFCELIYNLVNVLGTDIEDANENFADTDNKSVAALFTMKIINGKSAAEFAPNDYLTREEAAAIIIRMINKIMPMEATEMWFEYDDIDEISKWASDSVQTISNMGFMNDVGNNRFAPKDTYTTEQAIATLVRVYKAADAAGTIDHKASIGIIGGADGPTSIIVGDNVNVIQKGLGEDSIDVAIVK